MLIGTMLSGFQYALLWIQTTQCVFQSSLMLAETAYCLIPVGKNGDFLLELQRQQFELVTGSHSTLSRGKAKH